MTYDSHQRDSDRSHPSSALRARDADLAPNRATRSALLDAPAHPVASGLIQRRAVDDNGVAADAEHAVTTAASSTGVALPDAVQHKFEASLGTDLSSVRLHTGAASASAAAAVGAKAYTMGQDIHFGAGHSSGDEHLLAHEVAHTVQQRGGAPVRQHKLEVSSPGDHLEHEADRAADAMITGQPAAVSGGGGLQRRPTIKVPTVQITSKPYDGTQPLSPVPYARDNGEGPESISEPWTSRPNPIMPKQNSGETFETIGKANAAFRPVWDAVQAAWNRAVPISKRYLNAQTDAEAKGLADFGKQEGILDQSAEGMRFSTHTKVFDAFDGQNNVLKKGQNSFDTKRVSPAVKLDITKAKAAVADSDRALEVATLELQNGKLELSSAVKALGNASRALDNLEIDRKIAPEQRQADAYKKCAEICGAAIGGMGQVSGADSASKGAGAGGVEGAKIVNTLYWDSELAKIQGQITFLQGQRLSNDLASARATIEMATNTLLTAKNKLAASLVGYNTKTADRAQKYRDLAGKLEKAGVQSGLSNKDAEKISLAVQAKPLMELALSTAEEMHEALPSSLPAEDPEAERGCAATANREELISRYATLKTAKRVMAIAVTKWKGRLASADRLVNAAHD